MAKAVGLGVLLVAGLAAAACSNPGRSSSAPTNAISSNTTIPIPTSAPMTTAPALPPPTPAEDALLQDLYNVKSAGQTASASLTTASANQATGSSSNSVAQISATVTPVTLYLTTALNQLTAVIPTLPASALLTQTAQTLSSSLSTDLVSLHTEAADIPDIQEPSSVNGSAAVNSAMSAYAVASAISGYTQAVGLVNEVFSDGLVADFVKALSLVVNVSAASP